MDRKITTNVNELHMWHIIEEMIEVYLFKKCAIIMATSLLG